MASTIPIIKALETMVRMLRNAYDFDVASIHAPQEMFYSLLGHLKSAGRQVNPQYDRAAVAITYTFKIDDAKISLIMSDVNSHEVRFLEKQASEA